MLYDYGSYDTMSSCQIQEALLTKCDIINRVTMHYKATALNTRIMFVIMLYFSISSVKCSTNESIINISNNVAYTSSEVVRSGVEQDDCMIARDDIMANLRISMSQDTYSATSPVIKKSTDRGFVLKWVTENKSIYDIILCGIRQYAIQDDTNIQFSNIVIKYCEFISIFLKMQDADKVRLMWCISTSQLLRDNIDKIISTINDNTAKLHMHKYDIETCVECGEADQNAEERCKMEKPKKINEYHIITIWRAIQRNIFDRCNVGVQKSCIVPAGKHHRHHLIPLQCFGMSIKRCMLHIDELTHTVIHTSILDAIYHTNCYTWFVLHRITIKTVEQLHEAGRSSDALVSIKSCVHHDKPDKPTMKHCCELINKINPNDVVEQINDYGGTNDNSGVNIIINNYFNVIRRWVTQFCQSKKIKVEDRCCSLINDLAAWVNDVQHNVFNLIACIQIACLYKCFFATNKTSSSRYN